MVQGTNLGRKVALVTGSNQGLGLEVVRQLCKIFPGDVILTSRVYERGLEAVKKVDSPNGQVKVVQLDITDDKSVANLVQFIQANYGGLDVLVNNAAIFVTSDNVDVKSGDANFKQVVKEIMDINYFKTAKLTDELFPLLRKGARVVNVASTWGLLYILASDELKKKLQSPTLTREELDCMVNEYIMDAVNDQHKEKGWVNVPTPNSFHEILDHTYRMSKVFLICLTNIQKRLWCNDPRGIIVNAVHPGFVATQMTTFKGRETLEEGAKSLVYAASTVPPDVPTGKVICYPDLSLIDWDPREKDKQRVLDEREFYIRACSCTPAN